MQWKETRKRALYTTLTEDQFLTPWNSDLTNNNKATKIKNTSEGQGT